MKISVVLTTYNGQQYILQQLESIKDQSLKVNEVLIFDDCSTDSTIELVNNFISKNNLSDMWSVHLNMVNKGWKRNFYDAINYANGDLIFLSDQDDIWEIDKVEKMAGVMKTIEHCEVLACNFVAFYDGVGDDKSLNSHQLSTYKMGRVEKVVLDKWWMEPWRPGCCMCIRKSVIDDFNKVWFEDCAHDLALWAIGISKNSAYILNEILHKQRRHVGVSTPSNKKNRITRGGLVKIYYQLSDNIIKKVNDNKFERKMRLFYKRRVKLIRKRNIIYLLILIFHFKKYPTPKSYIADVISMIN